MKNKQRSIILHPFEVSGILDGSITVLWRKVKLPREGEWLSSGHVENGKAVFANDRTEMDIRCPLVPGTTIWAKERWHISFRSDLLPGEYIKGHKECVRDNDGFQDAWCDGVVYAEDLTGPNRTHPKLGKALWRSAYHMPRWASRISLILEGVEAKKIQSATEEEAVASGSSQPPIGNVRVALEMGKARYGLANNLMSIHGPGSWNEDPWMWKFNVKRITPIFRS